MKIFQRILLFGISILFSCSVAIAGTNLKEDYLPGYYINGTEKVEGYIYFTNNTYQYFYFKKQLSDKRQKKTIDECQSFVVNDRMFVTLVSVDLKIGVWSLHEDRVFAEVITEGPLNLFKVYSMVGNASGPGAIGIINYLLEKSKTSEYVLAHPNNKKKFKNGVTPLVSDREDIVAKLNDGTYNESNITDLVKDYNGGSRK